MDLLYNEFTPPLSGYPNSTKTSKTALRPILSALMDSARQTRFLLSFCFALLLGVLSMHQAQAQVNVALSVSDVTKAVNTPFTYTLDIVCPSTTGTCTNAVVTFPLHSSLDYIGASPATGNVQNVSYNAANNTVTVTMNPAINGTTDQVQIVVNFKSSTFTGTIATGIAYGGPGLTNPSNTVTTEALGGQAPPDFQDRLKLNKSSCGNFFTVMPGGGVQYCLSIENKSQNNAITDLVLEDVFPASFALTSMNTFHHYTNDAVGANVHYNIYYKTNLNGTYTLWPGSPYSFGPDSNLPVSALGLASGEKVSALKWVFTDPVPGTEYFSGTLGIIYGKLDNTAVPGTTLDNCLTATGNMAGNPVPVYDNNGPVTGSCFTYNIIQPGITTVFDKYRDPAKAGYLSDDIIDYVIAQNNMGYSTVDLKDFKIVDLLPGELDYVSSTIETQGSDFLPSSAAVQAVVPTVTPNYNGSGKTRVFWDFTGITEPATFNYRVFKLHIKAKVKKGVPTGVINNEAYLSIPGGDFIKCNTDNQNPAANYSSVVDVDDLNGDGSTTDSLCKVIHPATIVFPTGAGLESIKWVKGTLDTDYSRFPNSGKTSPGGTADYKMSITNKGNVAMKDIKVIDILPFVGDKGVIDLSDRNTQWRPFLIAPVTTSAANVTIYYSTAQNPCRDELTPGIPSGCTPPNWSTTLPADPTTVQSLKFDFGSTVMQPNDAIELFWSMRAPIDAPTNGEIAWNSFGYITTRNDNGVSLLASEPIKVGIAVKPIVPAGYGNYVWKDKNKNGLQDETPADGINGVRVDLYKAAGATPNIATDQQVTFTLTSSKNGAPGYYQFTNLAPGNYYAVFHKPINSCVITTPNVASTGDELDSDGIQTIIGGDTLAITDITTLDAGEIDFTWDLGLAPAVDPCAIAATATPGVCDPVSNLYSVSGTISLTGAVAGTATITDGVSTTSVAITAGATSVPYTLSGFLSDGATHVVTVSLPNCGTAMAAYNAPASCTVAASVVVTSATICYGTTATLTASGCTGTVSWNTGDTGASLVTPALTSTTSYTATCTTVSSTATAVGTVTVLDQPILSLSASSTLVTVGTSVNLSAIGCTGSVAWSTSETGASISVMPANATNVYSATCTTGPGCMTAASITINTEPSASLIVISATVCYGSPATLVASGCTGSVSWNTGDTGNNLVTPALTTTTSYTATCTTGTGSTTTAVGTVTVLDQPILSLSASSTLVTVGTSVNLSAIGCTGSVAWSTSETGASISVMPANATNVYSATCTTGPGCMTAASITINTEPSASLIVISATVCYGSPATLVASGCTGSVSWNTGDTGNNLVTPALTTTTSYTATCTTGTGSTTTAVGTVTVLDQPILSLSASSTLVTVGTSVNLSAIGCTGSVAWSTGETGASISVMPANATNVYSATCTTGPGCMTAASITINTEPSASLIVISATVCYGSPATLVASGCTGSVSWNTGDTGNNLVTPALTTTTSYTATCTTGTGSTTTAVGTVTVLDQPILSLSASSTLVTVGTPVSLSAIGCTGSVAWSTGETGASISVMPANATNTYSATCTTGPGCTTATSISINTEPSASLIVISATVCYGTSATLTASGCTGAISWNTGATGASLVTPALTTTTSYTATCTTNTSTTTAVGTVTVLDQPILSLSASSTLVTVGTPVSLSAIGCTGSVAWSTGETGASISVMPANATNVYSATCTTGPGCTTATSISINTEPSASLIVISATVCYGTSATLTASGCTGAISWNTGATGASLVTPALTTTTSYTATCTTNTSTTTAVGTVTVLDQPILSLSASSTLVTVGTPVSLSAIGCTGSVAWSTGETGASISVTPANPTNVYSATCTTGPGCTKAASITVNTTAACSVSLTTNSLPIGIVGQAYSATLTATGGTAPYSFSLASGSLPAGITLNTTTGVLSGTPTNAGSFSTTIRISDSQSCSAVRPLAVLQIELAPVCSLTATATPGACSSATNTYTVSGSVSLTNNTTGGTILLTDGVQSSTVSVSSGVTTVPYTLTGLVSDGSVHTVVATLSGCGSSSATYTAPGSCTQPVGTKLSLEKLVNKSKAKLGDVLTYTLVLTNVGTTTASNVVVTDSSTVGLTYVANSATAPSGTTFTQGSPISHWSVSSISAGQSLSLTFQAIADSSGILYNKAYIPGDTATVCTSVPYVMCAGSSYLFRLTVAPGRSSYKWFKDNVEIVGQTTNVLDVTAPGTYSLAVDNVTGQCPDFGCCPFIVEEDTLPTFQAVAVVAGCVGNVAQANGQLVVSHFNAGYTYQYSLGSSFNASASLSGAAKVIPGNGVLASTLANPVAAQAYTIRVYNASGCYTDMTVMLLPTVCECPPASCVPLVIRQTRGAKRVGR